MVSFLLPGVAIQKHMTAGKFIKNLFYYLSPFSLVIIYCIVGVLLKKPGETSHWTHIAASMLIPSFFILGGLYAIIRLVLKERILWIWAVEAVTLLLLNYIIFN